MTDAENAPDRNPSATIAGDPYAKSRELDEERSRADEAARVRSAAESEDDKADAAVIAEAQAEWEAGVLADAKAKKAKEAEADEDLVTDEDEAQAEATEVDEDFVADEAQAETDAFYDQAEADGAFE